MFRPVGIWAAVDARETPGVCVEANGTKVVFGQSGGRGVPLRGVRGSFRLGTQNFSLLRVMCGDRLRGGCAAFQCSKYGCTYTRNGLGCVRFGCEWIMDVLGGRRREAGQGFEAIKDDCGESDRSGVMGDWRRD